MAYKAVVSGHMWISDDGGQDIELLTLIHNDEKCVDVFCDIETALIDQIDIGDNEDYYFIAIVESEFVKTETFEGVEYDVEHTVTEIKSIQDIK